MGAIGAINSALYNTSQENFMPEKNDTNIEMATVYDLPRIVEMKISMFREGGHLDLLANDAARIILQDYQSLYEQNLARHFVMCAEGRIIASAGAFIKSDLPYRYFAKSFYGFIGDVYTEEKVRGRGFATDLTHRAIEWLSQKGVTEIRLLAFDAGRRIYERMGFEATDEMVLNLQKYTGEK
jgi:GNAT superfamily N-acetyltransferase